MVIGLLATPAAMLPVLKQTDFGMVPVTAVGGTIRVKDELDIQFVLRARPSGDIRTAR